MPTFTDFKSIKKIHFLTLAILLFAFSTAFTKNYPYYTLTKTQHTYSLQIFCKTKIPKDSIFHFLLDTTSVKKLNTAFDSISFAYLDSNSYRITTHFHYLTYKGISIYTKSGFHANDSISITLCKFTHNWDALPRPDKAEIYFKIIADSDASIIKYVQNIHVDKKLGWFETKMLQWQLDRYAKHFFEVIQNLSSNYDAK